MPPRLCSLMVHNSSNSEDDILLNPDIFTDVAIGDYVQISAIENQMEKIVLKITSLHTRGGRLEVSLSKTVADSIDLKSFNKVLVEKIDRKDAEVDFAELAFRKRFLQRGNMLQFKNSIGGRTLHVGQTIEVGGVQVVVQELGVKGQQVKSGIMSEKTNVIFRSRSTRIFWLVEISAEMWEVDQNGELYFDKFLTKFVNPVLDQWKSLGVFHSLSIVYFTRTYYFTDPNIRNISKGHKYLSAFAPEYQNKSVYSQMSRDGKEIYYKDFFKVVLSNATGDIDKQSCIKSLKQEFWNFPKIVGWKLGSKHDEKTSQNGYGNMTGSAIPCMAAEGNVLGAINTTLNVLDKHYMDRDLVRTGNSIVLITAGTGYYKVDPQLAQITKQRMMDTGIGMDLICLSQPPFHVTPLFLVVSRDNIGGFYEVPHWITISYIDKRDVDMARSESMTISHLSIKHQSKNQNVVSSNQSCSGDDKHSKGKFVPFAFSDILHGFCSDETPEGGIKKDIPDNLAKDCTRINEISRMSKISLATTLNSSNILPRALVGLLSGSYHDYSDCISTEASLPSPPKDIKSKPVSRSSSNDPAHARRNSFVNSNLTLISPSPRAQRSISNISANIDFPRSPISAIQSQSKLSISISPEQCAPVYNSLNIVDWGSLTFPQDSIPGHPSSSHDYMKEIDVLTSDNIMAALCDPSVNMKEKSKESLLRMMHLHDKHEAHKSYVCNETSDGPCSLKRMASYSSATDIASGRGTDSRVSSTVQNSGTRRPSFSLVHRNLSERTDTSTATGSFNYGENYVLSDSNDEEENLSTSPGNRNATSQWRQFLRSSTTGGASQRKSDHHAKQNAILCGQASAKLYSNSMGSNTTIMQDRKIVGSASASCLSSSPKQASFTHQTHSVPIAIPDADNLFNRERNESLLSLSASDDGNASNYDIKEFTFGVKRNNSTGYAGSSHTHEMSLARLRTVSQSSSVASSEFYTFEKRKDGKQKISIPQFVKYRYGINPFRGEEGKNFMEMRTHNRRRWSHVFLSGQLINSHNKDIFGPNWPSLCQPAVLPLEVDYIPSCDDLFNCYTHSVYDLIMDPVLCPYSSPELLMNEMVAQRLAQEFQIVAGKDIDREMYKKFVRKGVDSEEDASDDHFWMLSMGHRIQFLYYIPSTKTIKVDRYVSKMGNNDASSTATYAYQLWMPQSQTFSTITQVFHQYPEPEYNWNQADEVLLGNEEDLSDATKAKRLRFAIVSNIMSDMTSEEAVNEYCKNFENLLKYLRKYCNNPNDLILSFKEDSSNETNRFYDNSIHGSTNSLASLDDLDNGKASNLVTKNTSPKQPKQNVKLWLKKSDRENPQWVHMECDQTFAPSRVFHFEIYWIVCYSWLVEDFVNVLFRRCLSWGLRIIQIPEYFRWSNMHLHPYRLHPFIHVPSLESSELFTGLNLSVIKRSYFTTVAKIEKFLLFEMKHEWITDDNQVTDWSAIGLPEPECELGDNCPNLLNQGLLSKRKVVINPLITADVCTSEFGSFPSVSNVTILGNQQKVLSQDIETTHHGTSNNSGLHSMQSSNTSTDINRTRESFLEIYPIIEDNNLTSTSKAIEEVDILQSNEKKNTDILDSRRSTSPTPKPPPFVRRPRRHIHYDHQYMQRMGYAAVRVGANGFFWLESSVPKANDLMTMSSEEKRETSFRKQTQFREASISIQICYEIVLSTIENFLNE